MNEKITYEKTIKDLKSLPPRENHSAKQKGFFSKISSALLITHLEYLLKERNWVAAIIMAASMLEFAGKTRLLWRQAGASKTEVRRIHKMDFAVTIKRLYTSGIVDKSTYEKMEEIRHKRNELAHQLPSQAVISLMKRPNAALEALVEEAIKTIQALFSSTD